MANLYEIDNQILECVDVETGEVIDPERLSQLVMDRDQKIENLALWVKDLKSDADAYKAEADTFKLKADAAKRKAESITRYLSNFLAGDKYKSTRVSIGYRKSSAVEIDDEDKLITLAKETDLDILDYKVSVRKSALSSLLKAGQEIDGCRIVEKQNIQIK